MNEFTIEPESVDEVPIEPTPHDRIDQLAQGLDAIVTVMGNHSGRLDALEEQTEKPKIAPWNWRELDLEKRQSLAADLVEFVTWFNTRYAETEPSLWIAECWPRHPIVIEELTALMISWQAAYRNVVKPNDAPINFHDRWLWPSMRRIHSEPWGTGKCVGRHEVRASSARTSSPQACVDLDTWVARGGTLPGS